MNEKIKKGGELCFWIAVIIELIVVIIDKSAYTNPYESLLFRLTFLLFVIKILTTKYSGREWLCIAVVGAVAVISYLTNGKDEAVRAVALVAACKGIDLKKLLKLVLFVTLSGAIVLFALSAFGIFGNFSVTADFGRGVNGAEIVEKRYCFGMGHPNAFQCMLFMMTTLVLYLYQEKMKLYHFVILFLANVASYLFTDSNTSFLVAAITIAGVMIMKYCKILQNSKVIYGLGAVAFIAVVTFSIYGAFVGDNTEFMHEFDRMLNGRFKYAYIIENARLVNWKLFAMPGNEEFFDQGFIRLFYWYGIIPAITYCMLNLYLIWIAWRKRDYTLLVIVVAYAVLSLMEAHLVSVYLLRNYLLLWLGCCWYEPLKDDKIEEGKRNESKR